MSQGPFAAIERYRTAAHRPASSRHGRAPTLQEGQRVGQWVLLEYVAGHGSPRTSPRWRCVCECGTVRLVLSQNLTSGLSTSCGHATGGRPPGQRAEAAC